MASSKLMQLVRSLWIIQIDIISFLSAKYSSDRSLCSNKNLQVSTALCLQKLGRPIIIELSNYVVAAKLLNLTLYLH